MAYSYTIQRKVGSAGELLPLWTGNITTGLGTANVVASSVGFAWYRNDMAAASTGTCTSGTLGSFTASSWVQALSTGLLGWYNFGIPASVFASGNSAAIRLSSAVMAEINIFVELTKTDNQTFMSSQTLSTNALVNVNQILGSTPVTSVAGMYSVNVSTILGSPAVTNAAGILEANLKSVYGTAPVTTAAGVLATTWDLSRTANLTSTIALTGTSISTNQLVNLNQILGSAPVTTAAGVQAVAWDLGRTANLTSTISLTGTALSTNQLVNVNQILGSTPVTSAAGTLKADLGTIFGSAPVTTSAGKLSVGIAGFDPSLVDVSVSSRLASSSYAAPDNTGIANISSKTLNLDVSVSSRLSAAGYTAPLSAAGTRTAVGLASANLDTQITGINSNVTTRLAAVDYTTPLDAAGTRTAVGLASANLDTQIATLATTTQATTIQAKTDLLISTTTGLIDVNLKAIKESALTGDGSATPFDV